MNNLIACVEEISSRILKNATAINKDPDATFEDIRKLAYIATNSNDEVSDIIQTIYKETRNPSIDFLSSKTTKTSYDIVEGYKLPFMTYIDTIFVNNDGGTCVVENPLILMIDFKLEFSDSIKKMISFAQMRAKELNKKLVIVCPFYDQFSMDGIKRLVMADVTNGRDITTIFTRVSLVNNMAEVLYNDFAVLTGGRILKMNDFDDAKDDASILELTNSSMGMVDNIVVGKDFSTISGFSNRNELLFEKMVMDANSKYAEMIERDIQKDIVTTETFELKRRASRLTCKMGVIHIGGGTELAKEANKDLIEDAVKACESAYNYGYNVGCSLSIVRTINDIIEDIVNGKVEADQHVHEIYIIIKEAFLNVYKEVLGNKYNKLTDVGMVDNIIEGTMEEDRLKCYDLINDVMSDDIINPCYTDIEILKAATSIISYIVTSNQYISIVIKEG
jgi:chaperonin GroEL (HSP60 family)